MSVASLPEVPAADPRLGPSRSVAMSELRAGAR